MKIIWLLMFILILVVLSTLVFVMFSLYNSLLGSILHEGVGKVNMMVISVKSGAKATAYLPCVEGVDWTDM